MNTISFESLSGTQMAGPNGTPVQVAIKVVDATGAAVADQAVTFSVDNDATLDILENPLLTDVAGEALVTLFSNTVGDATLTATLADGTSASTVVSFVSKDYLLSLGQ